MKVDTVIEKLVMKNKDHYCDTDSCVKMIASADLPTKFGEFKIVSFVGNPDRKEHAALIHGNAVGKANVPLRIHSECLTGDALGSLRCDCREQLEKSLKKLGEMNFGILLYLRQEGRGIGFANKIRAYELQDKGYDTFEANKILGFKPDERDYEIAAHMLKLLEVKSIKLMSNNPEKISDLQRHGVKITGRIPIVIKPNKFNKFYLKTKEKSGHMFDN